MLYYSIIFLVIFILILIYVYRRFNLEEFALSSGYIEVPCSYKKLSKKIVNSELAYSQQIIDASKSSDNLKIEMDKLKEELEIIKRTASNPNSTASNPNSTYSDSVVTEINTKFFDNKELYSILINGLNMKLYNPNESTEDSYGLKGINYEDDKTNFTRSVTDAINAACELLKQKQDYKYISKCVSTIADIDGAAKIHNLLIKAYQYSTRSKYTSNRVIDPYLVNKLNKNIKNIVELGRKILLANSNTCKCRSSKNKTLLENNLKGLLNMNRNIQGQILSIETTLNGVKTSIPPMLRDIPGFERPEPTLANKRLVENLKDLYRQRAKLSINIFNSQAELRKVSDHRSKICQPC